MTKIYFQQEPPTVEHDTLKADINANTNAKSTEVKAHANVKEVNILADIATHEANEQARYNALNAKSVIKSIQRGSFQITGAGTTLQNVTITPVVMAKSVLSFSERIPIDYTQMFAVGQLTSSTNIRFERGAGSASFTEISWELVEYA